MSLDHETQQHRDTAAPRSRRAARPAPREPELLRRVGLIGNRAAARVAQRPATRLTRATLQRAPVAPSAYLTAVRTNGAGADEWDPQWTAAITAVVANTDFTHFPATIDDASQDDARRLINILKGVGPLSNNPKSYRLAIDAIRWHADIEGDVAGSGFGSLDVSTAGPSGFSGRPAFPKITQLNVPVKSGQHRRHILAWHTIREFVSLVYAAQPDRVLRPIRATVETPRDQVAAQALADAFQHVFSGREKAHAASGDLTNDELLKIGLFMMNGNPRNLWPGKGSTNSALNTAQMHMNEALGKVKTFGDVGALAQKWSTPTGKVVYSVATGLGAAVLWQRGTELLSVWEQTKDPATESGYVTQVVDAVKQYVVSNLEIDVMSDVKVQNEIAQEKRDALKDPIAVIDNVVSGRVAANAIDPFFIESAITEFLTYLK